MEGQDSYRDGNKDGDFIRTVTKFKIHLHVAKLSSEFFNLQQNLRRSPVSKLSRVSHAYQFTLSAQFILF